MAWVPPTTTCSSTTADSSGHHYFYFSGTGNEQHPVMEYHVRDCLLDDLPSVCDLVMESFFSNLSPTEQDHGDCWNRQMTKLQETFHDTRSEHCMLVASYVPAQTQTQTREDSTHSQNHNDLLDDTLPTKNHQVIIGFVHIDNRPPPPHACLRHCPRPIVTDLMVCQSMRRKGIARKLMELCEMIAWHDYHCPTMYLRVVDSNKAAQTFYQTLGWNYCPDMREESRPDLLVFSKNVRPIQ